MLVFRQRFAFRMVPRYKGGNESFWDVPEPERLSVTHDRVHPEIRWHVRCITDKVMSYFKVIETDAGLQVAGIQSTETPADAATRNGGVIVDSGPYNTHEDAYNAMLLVPDYEKERARLLSPHNSWADCRE